MTADVRFPEPQNIKVAITIHATIYELQELRGSFNSKQQETTIYKVVDETIQAVEAKMLLASGSKP